MTTIPAVERRYRYAPTTPTTNFSVLDIDGNPAPVFDNDDITVYVNGVRQSGGYSFSGTYQDGVCTNAVIVADAPGWTGTVDIVCDRSPARTDQFADGRGVPASAINLALNRLSAESRESFDRSQRAFHTRFGDVGGSVELGNSGDALVSDGEGNMVPGLNLPALSTALANETEARINADTVESTERVDADNEEKSARIAADTAESSARAAADSEERNQRITAVTNEANARVAADSAEAAARVAGDKSVASLIGQAGPIEVPLYDTRTAATLANIKSTIQSVRTSGYASSGDGGGALYKKVDAEPSHDLKFQSADGAWWEIAEATISPRMAGAQGISGHDDSVAFNSAATASIALNRPIFNFGDLYVQNPILVASGFRFYNFEGTIYREHNTALALQPIFQSANYVSGQATTEFVENVIIKGVRSRDVTADISGCVFTFAKSKNIDLSDFDLKIDNVAWTIRLEGEDIRVHDGKIDSANGFITSDGIHVLGGKNLIFSNLDIRSEDDCIAFHQHTTWTEFKSYDVIEDCVVDGCILESVQANSVRAGAQDEGDADFIVNNIQVSNSILKSGAELRDDRVTINKTHGPIMFSDCRLEEHFQAPSPSSKYGIVILKDCNIDNQTGGAITVEINGGVADFSMKNCEVNRLLTETTNNVSISASARAEVSGCQIYTKDETAGTGNGVLIGAPEVVVKGNRIDAGDKFAALTVNASSAIADCEIVGNRIRGSASMGIWLETGGIRLVYRDNDIDGTFTTAQALNTWTEGAGEVIGSGAPTFNLPNGFKYVRTDGGAGTTFYAVEAGAWVAK